MSVSTTRAIELRNNRFEDVPEDADLDTLIAAANEFHENAEEAALASLRWAVKSGKALLLIQEKVKKEFGYGRWGRWFEEQRRQGRFSFSYRTCRLYVQIASLPEELWQRVAKLSLREAARIAAAVSNDNGDDDEDDGDGGEDGGDGDGGRGNASDPSLLDPSSASFDRCGGAVAQHRCGHRLRPQTANARPEPVLA
jgi:hypothetical protein